LKEDQHGQIHIEGLTEISITSYEEFALILSKGESNRFKRNTALNECSSRSHSIIEFICYGYKGIEGPCPKLTLCDLAGSEKFTDDQLKNKSHMAESRNINQSLSHLGR
jgi:hypothetical protein